MYGHVYVLVCVWLCAHNVCVCLQVEGFLFVLTLPFVAFTGFAFTKQWFTRLDDFNLGIPGPVAPSSALLLELRQRQLIAVLNRGDVSVLFSEKAASGAGGAGDGTEAGNGDDAAGSELSGGSKVAVKVDLTIVDTMYERAMAGPLCGPLLRLFLAQYIR